MSAEQQVGLSLDEIRKELLDCESADERLEYLIEIGETLPVVPPEACTEPNRVLGCQSMVWLVPRMEGDRIFFVATSDAPMVRGLIAILIAAYSGRRVTEILAFPIERFFEEIKLKSFITPMRSNGLHSMVSRVREIARHSLASRSDILSPTSPALVQAVRPSMRSLDEVRNDFPILLRKHSSGNNLVYLDSAASSQRPRQVIEAMSRVYIEYYSNVHRSGHELAAESTAAMESARDAIARYLHAPERESVIFTSGTTAGINLVARAWGDANIVPGDEILLSEMEHHSNIVPWQQLAERKKAILRWLPVRDDFQWDLDALPRLLSPRTKLVAVTAVSNVLGTINPIRELIEEARRVGSLVLVDAAQAIPHGPIDVQAMEADFVAFSGHKMLGPTGIGVLYGKRSLLASMPPFLGGGSMIHSVTFDGFEAADLPYRFEAGTPPIVEAIGMKPAVEYLESLGRDLILQHERMLVTATVERLSNNSRIRLLLPPENVRSGIVTFAVDGMSPSDIGMRLDAQGIAIRVGHHCAMPLHHRFGLSSSCRASFYVYNTLEDVERLCNALERILD